MSVITRKQMVEQDVTVVKCDGPTCTVEVSVPHSDPNHTPGGWTFVRRSINYAADQWKSRLDDPYGPWHFHDDKCHLAWLQAVLLEKTKQGYADEK